MEPYELVEELQRAWPGVPKGVTLAEYKKDRTSFNVFAEIDGLWLYVSLRISARNFVNDVVVVVDPTIHIVADRLLTISKSNPSNRGSLLSDGELRLKIEQASSREELQAVCKAAMDRFVKDQLRKGRLTGRQLRSLEIWSNGSIGGIASGEPA